jgi:hypothetical protein
MDDPRSPHTLLKTDRDVERYNPLSAVTFGVRTLEGWRARLKRSARIVQSAPTSLPRYRLWRLKRKVASRLRSVSGTRGAGFLMIFGYLVLSLLLYNLLGSNERVTLVQAKQLADPGWISGDWFLSTGVGYRLPFSMLAGALARFLPLHLTALAGRIAILALYSFTLQRYLGRLKVGAFLVLPFLFLHLRYQSLVAGEWIVTLFEAKSISYVLVLLALLFLMDRRYLLFALTAGLALSFHGMTGVYALLAMAAAVLLNAGYFAPDIPRMARNSYPLFLSGWFGLYAIYAFMARSGGADRELATWVQLNVRLPHHLLPSHWDGYIWVVKLFLAVSFLAVVYQAARDRTRRIPASFALGGSLFFLAGLLLYAAGRADLLTFFWFRFPDVMLPLFTLLLLFSLLGDYLDRWRRAPGAVVCTVPVFRKRLQVRTPKRGYRLVVLAFTGLSLVLAVQAGMKFFTGLPRLRSPERYAFLQDVSPAQRDALLWIRENTPEGSVFVVSPFLDSFNLVAERAMFVSYKHFPTASRDMGEWYRRMRLAAGGAESLVAAGLDADAYRRRIERHFYTLDPGGLERIADRYNVHYYLGSSNRGSASRGSDERRPPEKGSSSPAPPGTAYPYPYPVVYANGEHTLYRIAGPAEKEARAGRSGP